MPSRPLWRPMVALTGALAAALATLSAGPAVADPDTIPNGPWPHGGDENLSSLHSYDELWATLRQTERRARGAFDLAPAPRQSNTGRDIPVVTIGEGETPVMFIASQHGNEYIVGEAMLDVVRALSGNNATARQIRDQLTVTIVPRVNVDGFDAPVTDASGATTPWRQNYDPTCAVACEFYATGRGYDINRYHSYTDNPLDHPYLPGDDNLNPVPESIAMRLLWEERRPELIVDFHHQGSYVDDDQRLITGSLLWPNATGTASLLGISDEFAQTVTRSQRAVSVMVSSVQDKGFANLTRYPGTTTPGIARNAYGLLGSASVLFEMRGGIGQRSNGYIAKTASTAGLALLESVADGTWDQASLQVIDDLPERGDFVPAPDRGPE